jgi:hypothetical protein
MSRKPGVARPLVLHAATPADLPPPWFEVWEERAQTKAEKNGRDASAQGIVRAHGVT